MANDTHLFEDLRHRKNNGQVDGIADGLAIEGEGTFKFDIPTTMTKSTQSGSRIPFTYLK